MGAEVIAPRTAPASQHLSQRHGKRTAEQGTAGRRGTVQQEAGGGAAWGGRRYCCDIEEETSDYIFICIQMLRRLRQK